VRSPLARQHLPHRAIPKRRSAPWGVCLHTTGSGLPRKAKRLGRDELEVAVEYYVGTARGGPAYVVGGDGQVVQVADEDEHTFHVGSYGPAGEDRRGQYLSGEWRRLAPPRAVELWEARWPGKRCPQELFPSVHPNADYIGVEIIPRLSAQGDGLRFSDAQHGAVGRLLADIGRRHAWLDGWWRTPRLVGHEDVGLLDRSDAGGGWDPGALRQRPYISMPRIIQALSEALRSPGAVNT
jgi:N-acetyl-anhydromuramyl-L-alanine amidase AmpD